MVKRPRTTLARRLGHKIAAYRRRTSLTQEQLADRIDVETATISRYETGATLPSLVTLELLAETLHCTMAELLDEKPPDKSPEGKRIEAMLEPLPLDERVLVVKLIEAVIGFLRQRKTGRPRKRSPSRRPEDTTVS